MIDFGPSIDEPRLLKRAVRWSKKNRDPIPSLSRLAPKRSFDELKKLAQSWSAAGMGGLIELSEQGHKSILFSLDENALAFVDEAVRRSLIGQIKSFTRSDWISLGAFAVSIFALFK